MSVSLTLVGSKEPASIKGGQITAETSAGLAQGTGVDLVAHAQMSLGFSLTVLSRIDRNTCCRSKRSMSAGSMSAGIALSRTAEAERVTCGGQVDANRV